MRYKSIDNNRFIKKLEEQRELGTNEFESVLNKIQQSVPIPEEIMRNDEARIISNKNELPQKIKLMEGERRLETPIINSRFTVMGDK